MGYDDPVLHAFFFLRAMLCAFFLPHSVPCTLLLQGQLGLDEQAGHY
jgi:hypothetical protein